MTVSLAFFVLLRTCLVKHRQKASALKIHMYWLLRVCVEEVQSAVMDQEPSEHPFGSQVLEHVYKVVPAPEPCTSACRALHVCACNKGL